ncbi:MAG: DUF177 domain-containing protein [Anaerolineae bacterium]
MRFNVAELLKDSTGTVRKYELDEEIDGIDSDIHALKPLQGRVKLARASSNILVRGRLRTEIELTCDRCLKPFAVPIELTLEEEFRPTVDIKTGADLPKVEDFEGTRVDEHHVIDLTEVVRQNILLAAPMHPLCHPNCAGLCPQCGQNLNEGACQCESSVGDPRWTALRELELS